MPSACVAGVAGVSLSLEVVGTSARSLVSVSQCCWQVLPPHGESSIVSSSYVEKELVCR